VAPLLAQPPLELAARHSSSVIRDDNAVKGIRGQTIVRSGGVFDGGDEAFAEGAQCCLHLIQAGRVTQVEEAVQLHGVSSEALAERGPGEARFAERLMKCQFGLHKGG